MNKCIYGNRCINIHIEKETINFEYEKHDNTEYNDQISYQEYERAEQQVNDGIYFEDRIQNIYEKSFYEYDENYNNPKEQQEFKYKENYRYQYDCEEQYAEQVHDERQNKYSGVPNSDPPP